MKFIIERNALSRMLRLLNTTKKDARDKLLRLAAQDGQIVITMGDEEAGYEGLVLEEGVCFFRPAQFRPLVRAYATAKNLTVEVTSERIQIGNTKIGRETWEISLFQNPLAAPSTLTFLTPKTDTLGTGDAPSGQGQFDFPAS